MKKKLEELGMKGGLIVSCQAATGKPLHGSIFMAAMAKAAEMAGAVGIRADGPADITAIKAAVKIPVIGIYKVRLPMQHKRVYITPTFELAIEVARLGCEIIALHVLPEYDQDIEYLKTRIRRIKEEMNVLVMADIATIKDAVFAVEQGVDIIATTSARYAYPDEKIPGPAIELIQNLKREVSVPIIAEGHYESPEQCAQALEAGAHAVVVGTALTAPEVVIEKFIKRMQHVRDNNQV